MIALGVTYIVKDGEMDEVLGALRRMKAIMRDNEPGCRFYQVSASRTEANTLLLYEVYEDEAALDAHGKTPHFESIIKGEVIPRLESRVRSAYDVVVD